MDRPDRRKTNVVLDWRDVRKLKRQMLDWEDKYEFPIELKESHCHNALIKLILRASSPELIDEYAKNKGMDAKDKKALEQSYEWFEGQFIELMTEDINKRIEEDKRRIRNK